MTSSTPDLIVLGAGPAGLALAAAGAEQGLSVVVIDPEPHAAWPASYGAWKVDLPAWVPIERSWSTAHVAFDDGARDLRGDYARIDKAALQALLLDTLTAHGGELMCDRATALHAHDDHVRVQRGAGVDLHARVVIDATGRGLTPVSPPTAFQAAYGVLARVRSHPWAAGHMALMDFSVAHLNTTHRSGVSSFLYALPYGPDRLFVEETSLAASPAVPLPLLRDRLYARLAHLGVEIVEELEVERCIIPMNTPIPRLGLAVPFGAAAGLIHPATGYQLSRSLTLAEPVARAIAAALPHGPSAARRAAWSTIWPTPQRRTRALHDLGLQLLLSLNAEQTRAFFSAFFDLPEPAWRAYLRADAAPGSVARAMAQVFTRLDPSLRRAIVALALGRGRHSLLRVLTPQLGGVS